MKILFVSATATEILPLMGFLDKSAIKKDENFYSFHQNDIYILITGPGLMSMTFAMTQFGSLNKIDLAINIGIAGTFDPDCTLGSVYNVYRDRIADLGAEFPDGSFQDIFEMKLTDKDEFPFKDGWVYSNSKTDVFHDLPKVSGVTVNMVSGNLSTIEKIKIKYRPDIESMEGAGFFYVCNLLHIPCLQIRSISNYIEPRNKANWKINDAVKNLNDTLIQFLADDYLNENA
ncbi:MAG: futalosine hydrolase [Saprospiraceae bacterium]|nr:futalosine hydrolase [Saprospiraceae bacterium]MBP6567055.1 futalosine hydrolase [Saprospiraceae bacterium]